MKLKTLGSKKKSKIFRKPMSDKTYTTTEDEMSAATETSPGTMMLDKDKGKQWNEYLELKKKTKKKILDAGLKPMEEKGNIPITIFGRKK